MRKTMIRLDQLASAGLSDAEKIDALASGLASMAQLLHRTRLGGSTAGIDARFDADGMVLVPVPVHASPHTFEPTDEGLTCKVCTKGRYHAYHPVKP